MEIKEDVLKEFLQSIQDSKELDSAFTALNLMTDNHKLLVCEESGALGISSWGKLSSVLDLYKRYVLENINKK